MNYESPDHPGATTPSSSDAFLTLSGSGSDTSVSGPPTGAGPLSFSASPPPPPKSASRGGTRKRPAAVDEEEAKAVHPEVRIKRQRNNEAARKYRQKKVDRIDQLELEVDEVKRERDELRIRLARQEAENAALREMLKLGTGTKGGGLDK